MLKNWKRITTIQKNHSTEDYLEEGAPRLWITSTDVDFFIVCSLLLPDATSPEVVAAEAAAEVALSLIELSVLDSHVLVPEDEAPDEAAAVLNCNGTMEC